MQERIEQVAKQIEGPRKAVKKLQLDFAKVVESANATAELLRRKVDVEEGQRLWDNFERYALYEDLKELYMKTVPEIFKFEARIGEHQQDVARQNEILRRFDEVLADKASKENVHELALVSQRRYALIEDFARARKETGETLAKNSRDIAEMQVAMDILGKQITRDIFQAVKKATSHLQKNSAYMKGEGAALLEQVAGGASSQQLEEIKALVRSKAEAQEVAALQASKANKIDTQLAMRWVEVMNRQLKQLVVLVTEMLRFEVAELFEGEQHVQHNRAFLFQQSLLVAQWVNRFSTQQVNEYFLESSQGLSDLNWTPPEVLAFQRYAEEKLRDVDLEVLVTRNAALAQNLKMRSKSLRGGGQLNLTATARAGFHTAAQSPMAKAKSPSEGPAVILNNKIQYVETEQSEEKRRGGFKTQEAWRGNRRMFNKTLMLGRGSPLGDKSLNLASDRSELPGLK